VKAPIHVAVTGAAGQIAYSLLFRLAHGDAFGPEQPVVLQLLDIPQAQSALEGVVMELEDCAFPLLQGVTVTDDPCVAFQNANWAILLGGKPRGPGMERVDVIRDNVPIFAEQGRVMNECASRDLRVLVVANPCNTNALVAMRNAPDIPRDRWFAMTRLDQNRARAQLAKKADVPVTAVTHLAVWGNHSPTMYPDFENARINGRPALEVIPDRAWFEETFIRTVQQRGKVVIDARGKSSAASAANAVIDHMRSVSNVTREGECYSAAILSDGNSYGVPEGLMFSFPLRTLPDGSVVPVEGLPLSEYARQKLLISAQELLEEREAVDALLK